jgi:hypothetical protein
MSLQAVAIVVMLCVCIQSFVFHYNDYAYVIYCFVKYKLAEAHKGARNVVAHTFNDRAGLF